MLAEPAQAGLSLAFDVTRLFCATLGNASLFIAASGITFASDVCISTSLKVLSTRPSSRVSVKIAKLGGNS
jgi:hypothetical protein